MYGIHVFEGSLPTGEDVSETYAVRTFGTEFVFLSDEVAPYPGRKYAEQMVALLLKRHPGLIYRIIKAGHGDAPAVARD